MLRQIARKWAGFVSRDTRSVVPSVISVLSGLALVLVAVFVLEDAEILLGFGVLFAYIGFSLFERAGLLMLMDEQRSQAADESGNWQHDGPGV